MLCDRCHEREALHCTILTRAGVEFKRRYCQVCEKELGLRGSSPDSLKLFPWEEGGGGPLSVAGIISNVEPETVVLTVLRSSEYEAGTELSIPARYLPSGITRVGSRISFSVSNEEARVILAQVRLPAGPFNETDLIRRTHAEAEQKIERAKGKPIETRAEFLSGGLDHLGNYVEQLQHASEQRASVIVSTLDGKHAILLRRDNARTFLSLSVDTASSEEQQAIEFFKALGMKPMTDRLSSNSGVPGATRTWHYILPESIDDVCHLCGSIFTGLFGIDASEGLRFRSFGI